jgi:hypothetical protein
MLYIALEKEKVNAPAKIGTQEPSKTGSCMPSMARPSSGEAESCHLQMESETPR